MNSLLLSCEHAGNKIPAQVKSLKIPSPVLKSHRGWDPGSLAVAKILATGLRKKLHYHIVSRLVIEYNRSLHHPRLWSEFSQNLGHKIKTQLIKGYLTYRQQIISQIKKSKSTVHFSIHSFTPVMNQVVRKCDIGLLYDPANSNEKKVCHQLKRILSKNYLVKMNYPYQGKSDGLTKALRKQFGQKYSGIEIEINQKLIKRHTQQKEIAHALLNAIKSL